MVLVASEPIEAGAEIRIDYEDGNGGAATYWGTANNPAQPRESQAWRWARHRPPPPATSSERTVDGLAQLQRTAAAGGVSAGAVGWSLVHELREGGGGEEGGNGGAASLLWGGAVCRHTLLNRRRNIALTR